MWYFNPRSPRGERPINHFAILLLSYFNPRSPRGERPFFQRFRAFYLIFQSTLSARRATTYLQYASQNVYLFQSTLSARRATVAVYNCGDYRYNFNPRSPRGERPNRYTKCGEFKNFNPRSPRGERRLRDIPNCGDTYNFNPRSPRGERHYNFIFIA